LLDETRGGHRLSRQHLIPYVGPARNVAPGQLYDYPFDFLPHEGPRGLRLVVHAITIECTGNFDSVSTAAIQGEDMCGLLKQFRMADRKGPIFDLPGDQLRAWCRDQIGDQHPEDPADRATSASAVTVTYRHYIPLALPRFDAEGAKQFAIPADYFKQVGWVFRLVAAGNTDLQTGGTYVLNASTGVTFRVIMHCAEEFSFATKQRFEVTVQATEDDSRFPIKGIANLPIVSLFLHKAGASGGSSMANITDIDCAALGWYNVRDEDVEYSYRSDMPGGGYFEYDKDPFDHTDSSDAATSKAFPLVWTPSGAKLPQLHVVGSDPEVLLTESSAITSKKVIKTVVTQPSIKDVEEAARARRVRLDAAQADLPGDRRMDPNDPYNAFISRKVSGRAMPYRVTR
jgi:hypothetical protein